MRKTVFIALFLSLCCFFTGCTTVKSAANNKALTDPDATIGTVAQIVSPHSVEVEGVGLVADLNGKGSSECPTAIRRYLTQYIMSELPEDTSLDPDSFIDSLNTAVVLIQGVMPVDDSSKPYFDLKVTAYQGTQTLSLENGKLYESELKTKGSFGINTDILAYAEGPVFTDKITNPPPDKRIGYVLGGGKIDAKYVIGLVLSKPDFALTNMIRNRLNMRFDDVARAGKAGIIQVTVPERYRKQRGKFIDLIKAMYIYDIPANDQERINKHIRHLVDNPQSDEGEIALEAIGNQSLNQLSGLLNSPDEHVRLRAARCMLNLKSDEGMRALNSIIANSSSPYRIEALEAVTRYGRSRDASALSLALLKDDDFNMRFAAYEQLHGLNDAAISRKPVGSRFYLETVSQTDNNDIYVSRSGEPVVVLFGPSLSFNKGFTVQSGDSQVTIDAPSDRDYVIITRKFSNGLTGRIPCTYNLDKIIESLCKNPPERERNDLGGLGVSYSDLTALLKQMCDKGAVDAKFHAGPLPKIG